MCFGSSFLEQRVLRADIGLSLNEWLELLRIAGAECVQRLCSHPTLRAALEPAAGSITELLRNMSLSCSDHHEAQQSGFSSPEVVGALRANSSDSSASGLAPELPCAALALSDLEFVERALHELVADLLGPSGPPAESRTTAGALHVHEDAEVSGGAPAPTVCSEIDAVCANARSLQASLTPILGLLRAIQLPLCCYTLTNH